MSKKYEQLCLTTTKLYEFIHLTNANQNFYVPDIIVFNIGKICRQINIIFTFPPWYITSKETGKNKEINKCQIQTGFDAYVGNKQMTIKLYAFHMPTVLT